MQRSPEEQLALQGGQAAGTQLSQTGAQLTQTGMGATAGPLSYYSALLGGDRAKMAQATAGPRGAITDQYRGAENSLERSGIRGAARDKATAELARDRAGKVAGLTTGVQPAAANALADIGTNLIGQGNTATANSASVFNALLGQGVHNREYGRQEGEKFGTSMGSLLFDILRGIPGGGGGGGSTPGPWSGGYRFPSGDWRTQGHL